MHAVRASDRDHFPVTPRAALAATTRPESMHADFIAPCMCEINTIITKDLTANFKRAVAGEANFGYGK